MGLCGGEGFPNSHLLVAFPVKSTGKTKSPSVCQGLSSLSCWIHLQPEMDSRQLSWTFEAIPEIPYGLGKALGTLRELHPPTSPPRVRLA